MSYSPEQLKKAFVTVLNERVPDLSKIPDHVFSERFEKKMKKLIAREAAHPWAVSHTAVKNLIIAAIVIILMIAMCLSVSGIREAIYNFFVRHFDNHNEIIFDDSQREIIEKEYEITFLPDGFALNKITTIDVLVRREYTDKNQSWIVLDQRIPSNSNSKSIDNERNMDYSVEIDNVIVYYAINENTMTLVWEYDNYEFWLEIYIKGFSLEDAIRVYQSVKPVTD